MTETREAPTTTKKPVKGILTEAELKRLGLSIEQSRTKMAEWRQERNKLIAMFSQRVDDKTPINLMHMAIDIYLRTLVPKNPAVMVSSDYQKLAVDAARMQESINNTIERIDFHSDLSMTTLDAMFGIGITKTGLAAGDNLNEADGDRVPMGSAFADHQPFDEMLFDMNATNYERDSQFIGNYYEMDFDDFREDPLFSASAKQQAEPMSRRATADPYKTSDIAGEEDGPRSDDFREKIELLDVYVVKHRCVVTFDAGRAQWHKPLRETPYDGPPSRLGPYKLLSFSDIPGNAKPLSPAEILQYLHDLANRLFNKLSRQAEREKTVTGYRPGMEGDADRLRDAEDGEMISMQDPTAIQEHHFGGPNQVTLAFVMVIKDLFSYVGGNLDALGGLSPMSGTVGQDRMLEKSASKRMDAMQDRVLKHVKRVTFDLAYHIYGDPLVTERIARRLPGYESIQVEDYFGPENRTADFLMYNFDIDPYSMQDHSPSTQLQILTQTVQQYVVPLMPLMQAQGVNINVANLLRRVSELASVRKFDDLIMFSDRLAQGEAEPTDPEARPMKAPNTSRTYTRINRPGATNSQKTEAMIQHLLGNRQQPAQQATMTRAVA